MNNDGDKNDDLYFSFLCLVYGAVMKLDEKFYRRIDPQ
jgi:hypothetical protein